MIGVIKERAAQAARKSALTAGAIVSLMCGIGFLSAAAWIYLSTVADPLVAALVLGGIYCGLGLILLAAALSNGAPAQPSFEQKPHAAYANGQTSSQVSKPSMPPLAEAFVFGLNAGL